MSTNNQGKVILVGAGPGDPGLLTVAGREWLRRAQVVVYDRLVNPRLLNEVSPDAEVIFAGKAARDHALTQEEINRLLVEHGGQGKLVVRLKGGDPFVFGRGGEEAEALLGAGIPFEVVPGVTSAIAAPAYAGIPVTHRGVASSFAVITGHEDPTKPDSSIRWDKLATGVDTLIFLMGVENLPQIVQQLVANGRAPETPIALVRRGTWPAQETLTGTLADIQERLKGRNFGAPAVTVVGDVVGLREDLRWFDKRPLFGKRVLVTRSRDQASQLSEALTSLGAEVLEAPAITIEPPSDFGPLNDALRKLSKYGWTVFTSVNGVSAVFEHLRFLSLDARSFSSTKVAAVGAATAAALEQHGIVPDFVPSRYLTSEVAAGLGGQGISGVRVLLPRTDLVGEDLAGALKTHGAQVDQVVAYRTVQAAELPFEVLDALLTGRMDVITFASSSTVTNLMSLLKGDTNLLTGGAIACIGPVTARTAREAGLSVDIEAQEHTIPGLVAAIVEWAGSDRS